MATKRAHIFLIFSLLAFPFTAGAIEAPPGQLHIGANDVVRGHFTEERQIKGIDVPMRSSGSFVLAPARGLIWGMEKPFAAATIVTPNGLTQDIGGVALKLPVKNLRRLYDMIGGALAGDWNGLANDFIMTRSGNEAHWQMLLTAKPGGGKHALSYATITITGGRFVENIAMTKADGSYDVFSFTDEALSSAPLPANELAAFNAAAH